MSPPVALVTGGSRGIGARICRRLASEGFDVAISYAQSQDKAERVAETVEGEDQRAVTLAGDVGDAMVRRRLVERTVQQLGSLDVLVNNAGQREAESFLDVPQGALEQVLRVDVSGCFHMTQLAGGHMREEGGGSIVNVAAAAGIRADPAQATFSIAKAGMLGVTRAAAVALAPDVTVNAVAPAFVPTQASQRLAAGLREAIEQQAPAGRWTSKAEVADAVTYLAQAPNTLTGEVLGLDGGLRAQLYAPSASQDTDEAPRSEDLDIPQLDRRIQGPPDDVIEEDGPTTL